MKCFQKEKQELFIDGAILIATNSELSCNRILKDPELWMLSIHALFLQLLFVQTGIKYSIMCLESDFVFVIHEVILVSFRKQFWTSEYKKEIRT